MAQVDLNRDQEKKKIEEAGPVADLAQAAGRRDEGGNGATDVEDAAVLSSDVVDYNKLAPSIQTAVDQYGRERVREELLKTFVKASSIEAAIDQYGRERVREELMETIAEAPSIQTVVDQYGRERVREELMETFVKEFFMQTGPGDPGGRTTTPRRRTTTPTDRTTTPGVGQHSGRVSAGDGGGGPGAHAGLSRLRSFRRGGGGTFWPASSLRSRCGTSPRQR